MTMTWEALTNIIAGRFATAVATPLSLPTAYPNAKFEPPVDEAWARVAVMTASGLRRNLGPNPIYRKRGILNVLIATPPNIGGAKALEVADAIESAFRDQEVSGVQFYETTPSDHGERAGYWQLVVKCPFYADDLT